MCRHTIYFCSHNPTPFRKVVQLMIDSLSLAVLEALYDSPDGSLLSETAASNIDVLLHLIDAGLLEEPGIDVIPTGGSASGKIVLRGERTAITPAGRSVVEERRRLRRQAAIDVARYNQQRSEEKAKEAQRRKERLEDQADAERRYHGQNKVTIIASLLSFGLGLLVEHFIGILAWFFSLFS